MNELSPAGLPADGRLLVHGDVAPALAAAGVVSVADVLARAETIRDLSDRANLEVVVGGQRFYVKLAKARGWLRRVPDPPPEAHGLALLAEAAVPCARVAFVGRDPRRGALTATFDLAPARALDELLASGALSPARSDRLLASLARLVARMHSAHLHHQDLYANHVFADPALGTVTLIDAERVGRHRGLLGRPVVKDLAAFDASLPDARVSPQARGRLLVRYLLARGLPARALAQPLARRIARKSARIRSHVPRTPVGDAGRPAPPAAT